MTSETGVRCDECDRRSLHHGYVGGRYIEECCEHHVLNGNPPADWHPLCMETWARRAMT